MKLIAPEACPSHFVILETAFKVGVGLMVMGCVTVVVPHSLVTAKLIVCVPEVLNVTVPGDC